MPSGERLPRATLSLRSMIPAQHARSRDWQEVSCSKHFRGSNWRANAAQVAGGIAATSKTLKEAGDRLGEATACRKEATTQLRLECVERQNAALQAARAGLDDK